MRFLILLFCFAICYVSLPITTRAVADTATPAAEPAAAEAADAKPAEEKPADAKSADAKPETGESEEKSEEKAEAKEEKKERKTHTVATKRMKIDVTLDGTFTAEKMTPIALRPEAWTQFEIVEIVPHGAEVHRGQTLIKFDAKKINEEIADLELAQRISELAIRRAEEDLPRLGKTLEMAADDAERLSHNTQEDYDRYQKIDRPNLLKSIENSMKFAKFNLDYEMDELKQLEKMYEADDLTEETEEIVLTRQRNVVEMEKFQYEQMKLFRDTILDVRLPRNDIAVKESLEKVALELARAKTALALDLNRARYELEQLKQTRAKSLDRHAKLVADRALMELKAPADGVLYYGECEDGAWNDMAAMISRLKPENTAAVETVLMTILERRPLQVLAPLDEDERPNVAAGQAARVVPPAEGADSLAAKVKNVSTVPVSPGKFAVTANLAGSELPEWIVAGVSCKLKINTYDKADAVVAPTKAIRTDDDDDEVKYVWLVDPKQPDAKAERRNVKLGKSKGDDTEILSGLAKGDVISLEDEATREKEAAEKAAKEASKSSATDKEAEKS